MIPAEIYVPGNIQRVTVMNRSLPEKGKKGTMNVIEGVLTGEGLWNDRNGSMRCVEGLNNALANSPRFQVVTPPAMELTGTGTRQLPQPLPWNLVSDICKKAGADALITLETFDSNTLRGSTNHTEQKTVNNRTVTIPYTIATMNVDVTATWRIYDPVNQQIVDQRTFTDRKGFSERGANILDAQLRLPKAGPAVSDAGYFAGEQYNYRISPNYIWVPREYFSKANADFKDAKFYVRAKEWEKAAEIWQKYTNDRNREIAGYACHNMALACEVQGKLDLALEWAKKAYGTYHVKKSRYYISTLENRIRENRALDYQLNN